MERKASAYATLAVFVLLLFGFAFWGLLAPDQAVSAGERRKLAQLPAAGDNLLTGGLFAEFDKYTADQFPARDGFRALNALVRTGLLLQRDVNGLYVEDGRVFKSDYPIKPQNIERFIKKTNRVYEAYIKGNAAGYYAAVIPDKGYYNTSGHLKTDAKAVAEQFSAGLTDAVYIDLFDALSLESYYKTDTHWSQDRLFPVMEKIGGAMGFAAPLRASYSLQVFEPFYGVYWGQSALNPAPDKLIYMTSPWTASAGVENLDKPAMRAVYDTEALESMDPYDLFLSGGTPLTTVTSPDSRTEKALVIFRDSFGSSIAPLFLEEYRSVTLIDLRYFSAALLPSYVDFTGKDVLVLYSSLILNADIQLK